VKLDVNLVGVHVGWGQNDNQVGMLLGQKMVDEIDFFPLCLKFFGEEFCNTCAGGQKYHHEPCNTHFQGLSQWPKNATIVKHWVPGFDQRSRG
jgi:hypothetical protein